MQEIRPTIIAARKAMVETYSAAFEDARKPPGAAEVFASIAALPEKTGKVRQPGGTSLDLLGLYRARWPRCPGCGGWPGRSPRRAARRACTRRGASRSREESGSN